MLFRSDRTGTARLFAEQSGLELETVQRMLARRAPSPVGPISPARVREQQQVADAFHRLGLIPRPVQVASIVWQPDPSVAAASTARRI